MGASVPVGGGRWNGGTPLIGRVVVGLPIDEHDRLCLERRVAAATGKCNKESWDPNLYEVRLGRCPLLSNS